MQIIVIAFNSNSVLRHLKEKPAPIGRAGETNGTTGFLEALAGALGIASDDFTLARVLLWPSICC